MGARSFLTDGLGSTLTLTDNAGVLRTQYRYDPYGATIASGDTSSNPFQYTGRENDGTGLYYYRARYYSPSLTRFISEDPIGLEGRLNLYTYAGQNPVSRIDPLGLLDRLSFDGSYLTGYDDMSTEFRAPAKSGPFGNGRLPEGVYKGSNLRSRTKKAMQCGAKGWSLDLDPTFDTNRTLLRIHPDGGRLGTEGCIGVSCAAHQTVYDALRDYFNEGWDSIPVTVEYPR